MSHSNPHPLSGATVPITLDGRRVNFEVEDWADRITGPPSRRVYGRVLDGPVPMSASVSDEALQRKAVPVK